MNVLVFGGTTEGRLLAGELLKRGFEVTVSVATPLGAEELSDLPGLELWVGRKDAQELEQAVKAFDRCIDATHPYAVLASGNIRTACLRADVPLFRLSRPESLTEGVIAVSSCAQAAEFLAKEEGNILLTTGSKELGAFAEISRERLYARVLPCRESLEACEALGLPHRNILALQGPFGQKMNEAMLEQYHIRWLVTKDGGAAGGFPEKLAAAQVMEVPVVLVKRPEDSGMTMEEILKEAEQWRR
mgnify:FL=1